MPWGNVKMEVKSDFSSHFQLAVRHFMTLHVENMTGRALSLMKQSAEISTGRPNIYGEIGKITEVWFSW